MYNFAMRLDHDVLPHELVHPLAAFAGWTPTFRRLASRDAEVGSPKPLWVLLAEVVDAKGLSCRPGIR